MGLVAGCSPGDGNGAITGPCALHMGASVRSAMAQSLYYPRWHTHSIPSGAAAAQTPLRLASYLYVRPARDRRGLPLSSTTCPARTSPSTSSSGHSPDIALLNRAGEMSFSILQPEFGKPRRGRLRWSAPGPRRCRLSAGRLPCSSSGPQSQSPPRSPEVRCESCSQAQRDLHRSI